MSGSRRKTASFILWDVGFAGNPEEADWIIRNQTVHIDGELITDPDWERTFFNGREYDVQVDEETLPYRTY